MVNSIKVARLPRISVSHCQQDGFSFYFVDTVSKRKHSRYDGLQHNSVVNCESSENVWSQMSQIFVFGRRTPYHVVLCAIKW